MDCVLQVHWYYHRSRFGGQVEIDAVEMVGTLIQ